MKKLVVSCKTANQFFEDIGVVKIRTRKNDGRTMKQPHVEYDEVTFRLAS